MCLGYFHFLSTSLHSIVEGKSVSFWREQGAAGQHVTGLEDLLPSSVRRILRPFRLARATVEWLDLDGCLPSKQANP